MIQIALDSINQDQPDFIQFQPDFPREVSDSRRLLKLYRLPPRPIGKELPK